MREGESRVFAFALLQRLLEAEQILGADEDDAAAGAIDVGDEEERDGYGERQDEEDGEPFVVRAVPDEDVAGDGDQEHKQPGGGRYAVPVCGLGVSLGVEDVVHAEGGERHERAGSGGSGDAHGGPEVVLDLYRIAIDRLEVVAVASFVVLDAKGKIFFQEIAGAGGVVEREEVDAEIFGADRVGFGFLVVLALVVAADGHRKTEADNEAQQGEGGGEDDVEVAAFVVGERPGMLTEEIADLGGDPEQDRGEDEDDQRMTKDESAHGIAVRDSVQCVAGMKTVDWNTFASGGQASGMMLREACLGRRAGTPADGWLTRKVQFGLKSRTNSTKVRTAMPDGPFAIQGLASSVQAVPAMSR